LRFDAPYTEADFVDFCSSYPTLAGSTGRPATGQDSILDEERQSVRVFREWTLSAGDDPGRFHSRLTLPYLGDNYRYIFPSIGGDTQALHPLLAWWAILFALSMLARYQPDTWTYYLDVDKCAYAVPLEALLDRALATCPELLLHAIRGPREIAQDLLDRAGLVAAQVHQIVPAMEDPIMRFFEEAFSDPNNWIENPPPDATPAIESYATNGLDHHDTEPEEIVAADIVDPAGEPANDTPPRVAEMIKSGAFDRKPRR